MTSTQKPTNPLFTRQALVALLLPLIAEQALSVTIGLADTLMVSSVGEAAVSGVSLVDSFNTLMIQVMSALATGGAVVTSQYIGHREPKNAKAWINMDIKMCLQKQRPKNFKGHSIG